MEGTIFETISNIITTWIPIVTSLVGAAAVIATATPNKSDDRIVQVILDVVNFLGANFGKAKNGE